MAQYGMLIDYEYCTGCRTCELACQQEHHFEGDKCGLTMVNQGPFPIKEDKWQYDWIPVPTEWCMLCQGRVNKGKKPSCVLHCQSQCMETGEVSELAKKLNKPKQVLFVVR